MGLGPALKECSGRTVLDIGCAEGLVAFEFAKAGATVRGVEVVREHLKVAERLRRETELPVTFEYGDLATMKARSRYDIVLALGVAHKLANPEVGVRFAFESSKNLMVLRTSSTTHNGVLKSKRYGGSADLSAESKRAGFSIESIEQGPRDEKVYYFRKC